MEWTDRQTDGWMTDRQIDGQKDDSADYIDIVNLVYRPVMYYFI